MKVIASVERLRLKFPGKDTLLFKDLSLTFYEGEKVLLLGPSGCGKSTLLQVLSGLIPHSIDIPMKAERVLLPDHWGYVFQDPDSQFCMPFVDEEIAFALENIGVPREQMKERIKSLLEAVGLFVDPHTDIHTLSGGMKQRLALASVLALEPDVLFLDEPTAMIDEEGTKEIWQTVKRIARDKTVIIVEHKIDHVLDFVDRIILLNDQGEIIADDQAQTVFSSYKDVIASQGIWYPGVWDEYMAKRQYQRPAVQQEEIIHLRHFRGFRLRDVKIRIEEATVRAGEWIAITGKNGAGKSTLLHALMRLIRTDGTYELYGKDSKQLKQLHRLLAFVFQNPEFQFVANSVREEIAYSLRLEKRKEEEITETVEQLLHRFHLWQQQHQHPYQLSMGQKRRLSVAASIVSGQRIFLLDEPTFGQDVKNTFALLELLESYRGQGAAIMMVTHDENIVNHFATRRWVIEDGQLVKDEPILQQPPKAAVPSV
ncbi:ABC transporter ATP-binding protein [Parageobacillus thermoglucosidasius]|uniref:ABC transporter ATP-binding protein n=1 Tax=Parageobacillus thermoglucosidasius TaxID=1426 RepID=UPI000E1708A9|nr:ABC transporter ATP-binding protein [Parageobacillus thermoglucosidasius]MED4903006.1 ATP-binding cassette domain-containing protein [Parageobacillus thermoglucosidasius]MED4915201.1 ATP-binding cassette domain-containing protein [Parageobacillus thermoglucosidasius]MED4945910.1 ATP-binding cassette domain-containing protein [Parageobacillus thermoglucosidasius]MED4981722.1 ATP-binding cassette domain-containing protein [Parageobacillus thermoglucosidasius]RDE28782.1 ATP-binding cassette do